MQSRTTKSIKIVLALIVFIAIGFLFANMSFAENLNPPGVITVPSDNSFSKTVKILMGELRAHSFLIKGTIDHKKIAMQLGHKLRPTFSVLFGRPDYEYPLISQNQVAALYVPMNATVWVNAKGKVEISYWDPVTNMAQLFNSPSPVIKTDTDKFAGIIARIVKAAAHS